MIEGNVGRQLVWNLSSVWISFFHHSIFITHHSSLKIPYLFSTITQYFSHCLWAPYLSLGAAFFFFPRTQTHRTQKKKNPNSPNPVKEEEEKKKPRNPNPVKEEGKKKEERKNWRLKIFCDEEPKKKEKGRTNWQDSGEKEEKKEKKIEWTNRT